MMGIEQKKKSETNLLNELNEGLREKIQKLKRDIAIFKNGATRKKLTLPLIHRVYNIRKETKNIVTQTDLGTLLGINPSTIGKNVKRLDTQNNKPTIEKEEILEFMAFEPQVEPEEDDWSTVPAEPIIEDITKKEIDHDKLDLRITSKNGMIIEFFS
jgi:hypothetical protein